MSLEVSSRVGDFVPETGYGTDFGDRASQSAPKTQTEIYTPGAGYGARRRPSAAGIAVTVAVHVVLLAGLLQLSAQFTEHKAERLIAVDLRPPPPPPAQETPPPPPREEIVAVKPPIEIPRPEPIAVVVEPDPVVVPAAAAPSMPRSEPAAPPAPAPGPSVIDASDLGTRMVSGDAPRYPMESRRKREQGTVVLSLIVGADGKVADINVSQSSGFHRLDRAALDAVRRWRWAPTIRNGRAVMVRGVLSIPFVLKEKA